MLHFIKKNGKYIKTITLPAKLRLVTIDDDVVFLQVDSISNSMLFGNNGKDCIHLSHIKTIHLRGITEWIKYSTVVITGAISLTASLFTVGALTGNLGITDVDNHQFILQGAVYTISFASLSALIYCYPRTKFNLTKYKIDSY